MKPRLALTGLIMLVVAGCGLISRPTVGGTGDCPAPAADTELLKDEALGYCLLYPKDYSTQQPNPQETIIASDSLLDVASPQVTITASDARGRAVRDIADAIVTQVEHSLPGWGVRQSTIVVGGETAIVLDNLPGQDIARQVVIAHNGQHFSLTFVPAGSAGAEAVQRMEQLYKTVVDSLRFIS